MRRIMLAATAIVGLSGFAMPSFAAEPPLTTDSFNSGLATGAALAPGTVTVRLRAVLTNELSYATDSFSRTTTGKNSGVLLGSYARLYPRFDAVAANGLEYGATMEVRQASGGVGSSTASTLYWRRYNGYVGTPTVGRLFFGSENSALGRLAAGTSMEDFDYQGGFNGDVPVAGNAGTTLNFVSLRTSTFYITNKLVYVSPSFAGFSAGVSWEPSQSTGDAQAANTYAASNAVGTQTSSFAGGSNLRRNTIDVSAQYKGSFGPVAVSTFVGYLQSGHINDSTATAATAKFKDLKVLAAGGRLTYGSFAVGGMFNTGDIDANGGGSLIRQGNRKGLNLITGAQYLVGPVIVGFQYINNDSAGNFNPNFLRSNLHETGVVIGGAFDYAPGATLFSSLLYGQRHQGGWNFGTGSAATGNLKVGNSTQVRAIQIGNTFKW
jgi:hypothetical protein